MTRGFVGKTMLAGVGLLLAGAISTSATAAPVCTSVNDLNASGGSGLVMRSQITSGYCVQAGDKLYGNFDLGNLPSQLVLSFNNNTLGGLTYYQLSFSGTYLSGTTYDWSYEVAVASNAAPGTVIVQLDSDFTQTAGGPSTLDKWTDPAGSGPIHQVKVGAIVQPGSVTSITYGPGVTNLLINESLIDNGTISSVTNTVIQFTPPEQPPVPEPATLALLGAGLAGVSFIRRRRRN